MIQQYTPLIALIAPLFFAATAVLSWFQSGKNPHQVKNLALASTVIGFLAALISASTLVIYGQYESAFLGYEGLGFSLRFDAVSVIMFVMISILAFVVMKFSFNYLDGDKRHGSFLGRMASAIAAVQLLVLSGNMGLMFVSWVLTSVSLHRLLVFYRERPGALIANRKKFVVARISDACLAIAVILIYQQFGTGSLTEIFAQLQNVAIENFPQKLEIASIFLAVAVIFKSAQLPTHGWLIEVMETPTPVSALLHAGLLNAGPFLIIRMSALFGMATYAPAVLIGIGGLTALFGSLVYLTQTSVKTALGYSSVAHMGFSLMVCGLGAFPAAMLHLVAHSFYKAHSFLSSGSVIDVLRATRVTIAKRVGQPFRIITGAILGVTIVSLLISSLGFHLENNLPLMFITLVITMGVIHLITSAIDTDATVPAIARILFMAVLVTGSFLFLESGSSALLAQSAPATLDVSFLESVLIAVLALGFVSVVLIQSTAPVWVASPKYQVWAIHLKNGLYINAMFDKLVGAWQIEVPSFEFEPSPQREKELQVLLEKQ